MSEQKQLHLPHIPIAAAPTAPKLQQSRQAGFAGLSRSQIAAGALVLGTAIWGMWVTKTLVTPKQDHIVSARLSAIVGDYVQAQARSAMPSPQVESEMRRFMAALDKEVQRRSDKGEIIMVGEAVLTKNVPDITDSIKKAVYASGIAYPRQASAQDMQALARQTGVLPSPTAALAPAVPAAPIAMTGEDAAALALVPLPASSAPVPAFGGYDGASGQ
ncbi:Conjugal transfer protein precursor [Sphingobium herbicidovorans NBRC 16415]|uniref:Conjugal transfer protein n=1 Tax=Sphingobium herbicidovorans (strain ATCC 700291 / DSM 11019 / CCUG 56400 / KCTC 2939 / LMG 18315 / NBRC 16415 / MH) TaxID=1219045 RepID=A0A086PBP8_SPHHM|nr:type-F conjugative transfer system protein TrbI [Sphingobium herbicidovorans]KFG90816.1 Conjugal transfer protein precursor [Sphingobium herbicidovorans NBRC 16415]